MTEEENSFVNLHGSTSRKRSKVSRACDCCRRKKIKCNAEYSQSSSKVTKNCDNCIKNQEECTFSRIPLKRGPSKGYIRDLEEKLEKNHYSGQPHGQSQGQAQPPNASPIILPPLNINEKIQGPFWKVPYEMPDTKDARRSSVDSVSSASTANSKSRLPSLKPTISSDQNSVISDSDDDYYSVNSYKSRRSSTSSSPRNSISSLSSLSSRIKKVGITSPSGSINTLPAFNHNRSNSTSISPMPLNKVSSPIVPVPPVHLNSYHMAGTPNSLESNLNTYYSKFHLALPILPFNERLVLSIIDTVPPQISELFIASLNHLVNYQYISLQDSIQLIYKLISVYPFNNFNINLNDNVLMLFFGSLVATNYSVLLSGNIYSIGISIALSIFNDFKVLENFNESLKGLKVASSINYDEIKIYLPRLYLCQHLIDQIYSLSFGIKNLVPYTNILLENIAFLVPPSVETFTIIHVTHDLLRLRDSKVFGKHHEQRLGNWNYKFSTYQELFVNLIKSKYEVCGFIAEIDSNYKLNRVDEDLVNDFFLKFIRLCKNLTMDMNSLSAVIIREKNTVNPLINLAINQVFKLIKLGKLILDSLVNFINQDLFHRVFKINNDLLNCFNNLNLNLILSANHLSEYQVNLLKMKLNAFNLNFNLIHGPNISVALRWKYEFYNGIVPFVEKEDIDGWL